METIIQKINKRVADGLSKLDKLNDIIHQFIIEVLEDEYNGIHRGNLYNILGDTDGEDLDELAEKVWDEVFTQNQTEFEAYEYYNDKRDFELYPFDYVLMEQYITDRIKQLGWDNGDGDSSDEYDLFYNYFQVYSYNNDFQSIIKEWIVNRLRN